MLQIFLSEHFLILYAVVVAISIWKYPRYYDTPLRYLPVLLMYIFLSETMGILIRDDAEWSVVIKEFYFNNNWLIYNICAILFFLFFLYVYHNYLQRSSLKKQVRIGIVLFIVVSLINPFLLDFQTQSQIYAYTLGGVMMAYFAICYLVQEYRKKELRGLWSRNLLIWTSWGIAIFYIGYTPLKYLRFSIANNQIAEIGWIRYIHIGLIYVLYSCLFIGFLLLRRMKQPPPSLND